MRLKKLPELEGDDYIYFKKGYKYQTTKDYWIKLPFAPKKTAKTYFIKFRTDGWLWIKRGYAWDGPSGPTIDTKTFMRASLIHDALYQLIRMQLLPAKDKKKADKTLHRVCREDGMFWLRSAWVYGAMKFSAFAISPDNIKKEYKYPK